jgi:hypothetical protein
LLAVWYDLIFICFILISASIFKWHSCCVYASMSTFAFHKDTHQCGSFYLITCKKPPSLNKVTLEVLVIRTAMYPFFVGNVNSTHDNTWILK